MLRHGHARRGNKSPTYITWRSMKVRCLDPNHSSYPNYGGRGVTVCPAWVKSFPAFLEAVGPRPSPEHSLDRKDPHGNYEPGNVRWATKEEQSKNRRANGTERNPEEIDWEKEGF